MIQIMAVHLLIVLVKNYKSQVSHNTYDSPYLVPSRTEVCQEEVLSPQLGQTSSGDSRKPLHVPHTLLMTPAVAHLREQVKKLT